MRIYELQNKGLLSCSLDAYYPVARTYLGNDVAQTLWREVGDAFLRTTHPGIATRIIVAMEIIHGEVNGTTST